MDQRVLQTDHHRYVIVSWLADGSTNAIYRGRRVDTDPSGQVKEVVLKHLLPEHNADPKLVEMFKREAVISHSLSHRNIVRTLDLVEAAGDYYIVMEFVRGGDLRALLRRAKRRHGKLSLPSMLFIVSEVLAALGYAHDKREGGRPLGLIHRDVSPSNVLLGDRGEVKLTDFGIVKSPTQRSIVYKVKGKIGYMAPEQARGEPVDLRADLFAVGVLLYELLVGERLFVGSTLSPAAEIFAQPIVAPSRRRNDVPPELDAVVLRALALDRTLRFSTAKEMRDALLSVAQRAGYTLSERALADDLRRACGDDPSTWLDLNVPAQSTLDGALPSDGTGVIVTGGPDDDDDEDDDDRQPPMRPSLPSRELTSVVKLRSVPELGEPVTELSEDPFAATAAIESPRRIDEPSVEDFDDEGAQTRVAPSAAHKAAARSVAARPAAPRGPRATFEAPVPRTSPPPPDRSSDAPHAGEAIDARPFRDQPTRVGPSQPIPLQPPSPQPVLSPSAGETTRLGTETLPVRSTSSPISVPIAVLDRALRGRTATRLVVTIVGLIVLIALGVWVGVLLSGDTNP